VTAAGGDVDPGARPSLTPRQLDVLEAIAADQVTWNRESFRWWHDEGGYTLCTAQAKRLVALGLARTFMAAGYVYVRRGYVEVTPAGRAALAAAGVEADR